MTQVQGLLTILNDIPFTASARCSSAQFWQYKMEHCPELLEHDAERKVLIDEAMEKMIAEENKKKELKKAYLANKRKLE